MTPEEAQALEPGTTPGPWGLLYRDTHPNAIPTNIVVGEDEDILAESDHIDPDPLWEKPAGNLPLIAAAPDMRATIAAQTWEYGVESYLGTKWFRRQRIAEDHAEIYGGILVRRPVGPVEVAGRSTT